MSARRQHRPLEVIAEEFDRGVVHMGKVVGVRPSAAQNTEDQLDKKGWLDQARIYHIGKVVKMAEVIALKLKAGAVAIAEFLECVFDGLEGIGKDKVLGRGEEVMLPVIFPLGVLICQRENTEIY